ncbi:MAG: helix-turn-helix domain-containing protein [Propionibacteriaceae bacterium]|jgi:DNA-binding PucR family transcriptional regulator|nr:helix-turn-helix domain-containing protein [Propionibacteriaceae bacterium]
MEQAASPLGPHRGRFFVPEAARRRAIAQKLTQRTAALTTETLAEMDRRHGWFAAMHPEHRSWITLVARAGIDHFVTWFADESDEPVLAVELFNAAPRLATRRISLHQTVELVKTTIEVVERSFQELPPADQADLEAAMVDFSRSVAFAAAEVYAAAAEQRGDWDTRLEAYVVDSVVRGEMDEDLLSRAAALGWSARSGGVAVAVGELAGEADVAVDRLHSFAAKNRLGALAAPLDARLVAILGGDAVADDTAALARFGEVADVFGPGPLVVGPVVAALGSAPASARPALMGYRAAAMAPAAPRPVHADDLLAERVLAGDETAGRALVTRAIQPLDSSGGDLTATLTAYLDEGSSVEATARRLFVHANTVRYRLRRIVELTGLDPMNPPDAFTLGVALRLARL